MRWPRRRLPMAARPRVRAQDPARPARSARSAATGRRNGAFAPSAWRHGTRSGHLAESQFGMVAAQLANLPRGGDPKKRATKQSRDRVVSVADAAKTVGVSPTTVTRRYSGTDYFCPPQAHGTHRTVLC